MQISQEAGKVLRYSNPFKNFPQFIVIHTVKDFGIINKAGVGVFLVIQQILAIWSKSKKFLCLFKIQFEYLEFYGSHTIEAWLGEFWALLY